MPKHLQWPEALRILVQEGEKIKVEPNVRTILSDADASIWFTGTQEGDVYAWEQNNERFIPVFLKELKPGDMILGAPLTEGAAPNIFFFVSSKKTLLHKVSLKAFRELFEKDSDVQKWMEGQIEKWVEHLLHFFIQDQEEFEPDSEFPIVGEADFESLKKIKLKRLLDPKEKHHIAWLEIIKGEWEIAGDPRFILSEKNEVLFPLSHTIWLESRQASQVRLISTCDALKDDKGWKGIFLLHQLLFSFFEIMKETELHRTLLRIEKKRVQEEELERLSVKTLGSILEDKHALVPSQEDGPLFKACDLIGQALNIKMIFPSYLRAAKNTEDEIKEICLASGTLYRKVKLRGEWWKVADIPLLAFYGEKSKPVALIGLSPTEFEMYDSETGAREPVTAANASSFSKEAYTLSAELHEKKVSFRSLIQFTFKEASKELYTILAVAILTGIVNLFIPFAMKQLFDSLLESSDLYTLEQYTAGILLVAFSIWFFTITKNYAKQRFFGISQIKLTLGLWARILSLPVSFFRRSTSGELITRFQSIEQIHKNCNDFWLPSFFAFVYASMYGIQMLIYSPKLAFIGLAGFVVVLAIYVYCALKRESLFAKLTELSGSIQGLVIQFISGIAKIRVAGAESRFFAIWSRMFAEKKKLDLQTQRLRAVVTWISSIFPLMTTVFIYSFAIVIFEKQVYSFGDESGMSIGTFVGFTTAFGLFLSSALECLQSFFGMTLIRPYWKNAKKLVEVEPEERLNRTRSFRLKGAVTVDHVSFRYETEGAMTLDDVSLEAFPGEMIGIVGPSGSGKSTLVRLLLGFEKPEQGAVYYDDQNIEELDPRSVRSQIGTVLQSAGLISGSIYDNIVGPGLYSQGEIENALHLSGFEEDLKSLPMGLHTIIPMGGGSFSGGQKQRLLLARALVTRPKILLLDEATSALDNKTQDFVSTNLDQLNVTRIVIAHRLSTIKNADRIYVIEAGKVIQVGTFEELAAAKGLFAEMLKRQLV